MTLTTPSSTAIDAQTVREVCRRCEVAPEQLREQFALVYLDGEVWRLAGTFTSLASACEAIDDGDVDGCPEYVIDLRAPIDHSLYLIRTQVAALQGPLPI